MNLHRPHTPRLLLVASLLVVSAELALGCGGASPMAGADAPKSYAGAPLETAAEDLTRYENDLRLALGTPAERAFAAPPGQYPAPAATTTATQPIQVQSGGATPPPPAGDAMKPEGEAKAAEARATAPSDAYPATNGDPCALACRALASMGRAASHICDIAGDSDDRCENAKGRVKNAEERVHQSCPSCG